MKYILAILISIFSMSVYADEIELYVHHDVIAPRDMAYSVKCYNVTYSKWTEYDNMNKQTADYLYTWLKSHKTCSTVEVFKGQ